jgi:hypothetical protein
VIQSQPRGFFASLFDLSFRSFVTPTIISVVYAIALILIAFWAIVYFASGFMPTYGLFGLGSGPNAFTIFLHAIGAIVIFGVGALVARIQLEFVMAVFRIAENTNPRDMPRA